MSKIMQARFNSRKRELIRKDLELLPVFNMFYNIRTPYLSQSKLADILKTILNSVPGNVVSVWFNRFASSAAA